MARYATQAQRGSQDLTATFTIAAIKLNGFHTDIISLDFSNKYLFSPMKFWGLLFAFGKCWLPMPYYPHLRMSDLPVTSKDFALECKEIVEAAGLKRVQIGKVHLLS
jgi:hypothetical protein